MRKLFFLSSRKQTVTIPQNKPKNKLLNRIFAIFFVILILFFMYYSAYGSGSVVRSVAEQTQQQPLIIMIIFFCTFGIGISIILFSLFKEIWRPSLDFTFHRNRRWIFMSIILFAVVVLNSVWWWIAHGLVNWLPQYGWQATVAEWFMGNFTVDTSFLSLMFGILFLTKSVPQKSLNYKTILIGAVIFELMPFLTYITAIAGANVPASYKNFLGYVIFQPWFWLDLTSGIVIFIGAVQLLRRSMSIKKLILIIFVFLVLFLLLGPLLMSRS